MKEVRDAGLSCSVGAEIRDQYPPPPPSPFLDPSKRVIEYNTIKFILCDHVLNSRHQSVL